MYIMLSLTMLYYNLFITILYEVKTNDVKLAINKVHDMFPLARMATHKKILHYNANLYTITQKNIEFILCYLLLLKKTLTVKWS